MTNKATALRVVAALILGLSASGSPRADELPLVADVEFQPFVAQVRRVVQTLDLLGRPLSADEKARIDKVIDANNEPEALKVIQRALDSACLVGVEINPESRVKAARGPAAAALHQGGWSVFLVKVHNEAGVTAELRVNSPNAEPVQKRSTDSPNPNQTIHPANIAQRWCDVAMHRDRPLNRTLSGLPLEYRIIQIYSRDAGWREAKLEFHVGQGSQDLGFRSDVDILFTAAPAIPVTFDIRDRDGRPAMASLIIRDHLGRVYPSPGRRLAPDFFFQPQVYRQSGETVDLSPGDYTVEYARGPEYLVKTKEFSVPETGEHRETLDLERWIEPAAMNWFSGDHHIHAAGCSHYESPTEGVRPEDMWRHVLGEDLNVGCVLTWGPCWYAQKEFFSGAISPLSTAETLLRYDVEVSGFPSSHAGHLCLLRLKEDDYPGTNWIEDWPSWCLPILRWGKSQGGVVGFAHTGWGLRTESNDIPNYEVPPFDGIGGNEYIVDVVHDAVDFLSAADTPAPWELNIWYHTLNCGFRTRISGETDFPCIYDERLGMGRSYVKLDDGPLDFDRWVQGVKEGRSYVSDGRSHLIDFQVDDRAVGVEGSELKRPAPGVVKVRARAAARLEPKPTAETEAIRRKPLDEKPYWNVERARIGDSRKVPVELIVNGLPVARREIEADGSLQDVEFDAPIERSSWVALRILPSSHTNPVFVVIDGKPIRASRKSAEWCLKGVDQCWSQKEPRYRSNEKEAAREAYDAAREAYRKILEESAED